MNVGELIEELKKHPADMRVVVRGYEAGLDNPMPFATHKIIVNANCYPNGDKIKWYFGRHLMAETFRHLMGKDAPLTIEDALVIGPIAREDEPIDFGDMG